ncbi:MAG: DUF86 domain-containing protein [Planctomycetota bacterium]|nr:DUF86 domain-containing protein [Planctomycetota bacterium]
MRSDRERLLDILEAAIKRIRRYTAEGRAAFDRDELVQNWVVSHIQRIGEACWGLSQDLKSRHPEVPWGDIVGMRHILVHNYFEVDLDAVAAVLEKDLPILKPRIEAILTELGPAELPAKPAANR